MIPRALIARALRRLWLAGLEAVDRPRRRRRVEQDKATKSTPRPEGLGQARRMRRPTSILFALLCITGCARGGACRPPPDDPVPADCKPNQDCPVDGDPPKPIEQPPT